MMNIRFFIVFFIASFLMMSCAPIQITGEYEENAIFTSHVLDEEKGLVLDFDRFSGRQVKDNASRTPSYKLQTKAFPMIMNSQIKWWINYYSKGNGRVTMKNSLEKLGRYGAYMVDILRREGLPGHLIYVAMAESTFKPHARSKAGAVGYWQFMPKTARRFGLKINKYVDERKDFNLSTVAAADYYTFLYSEFKDWLLSLPGYNCGEGCVDNRINKYGTRDFWTLSKKRALPKETRNYVPKVIAMAHIGQNPSAYGFQNIDYQEPLDYKKIPLEEGSHYSLSSVATELDVSLKELQALNPKYKTDYIPKSESYIRVPSYL